MKKLVTSIEDIYPLTIMRDRYGGVYSEGQFLAFNDYFHHLPKDIAGSDGDCLTFWLAFEQGKSLNYFNQPIFCGKGSSPTKALNNLLKTMKLSEIEAF